MNTPASDSSASSSSSPSPASASLLEPSPSATVTSSPSESSEPESSETQRGLVYAIAAYLAWGFFPILWKALSVVPAPELLAHRVMWSFVAVLILLVLRGEGKQAWAVFRDRKKRGLLFISTLLISVNWLVFIWAVAVSRLTEASLGYYINPLFNVLLGWLVLGEKLRRLQWASVALATVGVLNMGFAGGVFPWVSLLLAGTFALYGLVRKQAPVEPLPGLAVETGLVVPFAVAFLLPYAWSGTWAYAEISWMRSLLLASSGFATALPLLWFAYAARRLRLATMGIIQYLAPTLQLALAVLVYGEDFTATHALTFGLIWSAVAIYAFDAVLSQSRIRVQRRGQQLAEASGAAGGSGAELLKS